VVKFILTRWDFKLIERELVGQGLRPLTDFSFAHTEDDPKGWVIEFTDEQDALIWRLQHGYKWL
jgi:hypothetical protein